MTGTTHKAVDDTLRVVPMSTLPMHTPQAEILSSFFLMRKVSALPDPVANHSCETKDDCDYASPFFLYKEASKSRSCPLVCIALYSKRSNKIILIAITTRFFFFSRGAYFVS